MKKYNLADDTIIELVEALQFLVDTKKRKDSVGKDGVYQAMREQAWYNAEKFLIK